MGRDLINIRVELSREEDGDLYSFAKSLSGGSPVSKREFLRRLARRTSRLWKQNPDHEALKQLGLVRHGLDA